MTIKSLCPKFLVALDLPKYAQCLEINFLKFGLALLYIVIKHKWHILGCTVLSL